MKTEIKIGSNRNFGLVFFIVFLIISFWPILSGQNLRVWSLIISFTFLLLGVLDSKILSPLNKIWFKFGIFLGRIVSPVVMGVIFFFVVTPTGLLMRYIKKDIIGLKYNNNKTYWIEKKEPKSTMKNQF